MESYDDALIEFLANKANIRLALEIADRIEEVKHKLDRTFWERLKHKILQKLTPSKGWRLCLHRDRTGKENRVNLDLWYPMPPTKGGDDHGHVTVRRSPDPTHRGARSHQPHREGVSGIGPAF